MIHIEWMLLHSWCGNLLLDDVALWSLEGAVSTFEASSLMMWYEKDSALRKTLLSWPMYVFLKLKWTPKLSHHHPRTALLLSCFLEKRTYSQRVATFVVGTCFADTLAVWTLAPTSLTLKACVVTKLHPFPLPIVLWWERTSAPYADAIPSSSLILQKRKR